MKRSFSFYIKPFLTTTAFVMLICYSVKLPSSDWKEWYACLETTVFFMTIISYVYIKWIWRYCPLENIPRFAKKYKGEIHYRYESSGTKEAEIFIQQTLFSTRVKIKTDEITSDSITSDLIEEHGSWFLYYTYITNPQAKYSKVNPIQRGTARLEIEKPEYNLKTCFVKYKKAIDHLAGNYWTTSGTTGDISLRKES